MVREMNWNHVQGHWKQFKGSVKNQWSMLTDDELEHIAGHRDILIDMIQEKYGIAEEEAEKQVIEWERTQP